MKKLLIAGAVLVAAGVGYYVLKPGAPGAGMLSLSSSAKVGPLDHVPADTAFVFANVEPMPKAVTQAWMEQFAQVSGIYAMQAKMAEEALAKEDPNGQGVKWMRALAAEAKDRTAEHASEYRQTLNQLKEDYKKATSGPRLKDIEIGIIQKKAAFRPTKVDLTAGPTGLDSSPIAAEYTKGNGEMLMRHDYGAGRRIWFFFIGGRLWKTYEEISFVFHTIEWTYTIGGIHKGQPIESWQADAKNDPALAARVAHLFNRPAEELYDLQSDPYETKNLAADPALAPVKAALQQQLDAWMTQQKDQGLETEKLAPSRQGKSDEGGSSPKKKSKGKKKKA